MSTQKEEWKLKFCKGVGFFEIICIPCKLTSVRFNQMNSLHTISQRGHLKSLPVKYVLTCSVLVQSSQRRQHLIL